MVHFYPHAFPESFAGQSLQPCPERFDYPYNDVKHLGVGCKPTPAPFCVTVNSKLHHQRPVLIRHADVRLCARVKLQKIILNAIAENHAIFRHLRS